MAYLRQLLWVIAIAVYKIVEDLVLDWVREKTGLRTGLLSGVLDYMPIITWIVAAVGLIWVTRMQRPEIAGNLLADSEEQPHETRPRPSVADLAAPYLNGFTIYLPELVRNSNTIVRRTFENCDFYGPAIATFTRCHIAHNNFGGPPDAVLIRLDQPRIVGAIAFLECTLRNCRFYGIGFIGPEEFVQMLRNSVTTPAHP